MGMAPDALEVVAAAAGEDVWATGATDADEADETACADEAADEAAELAAELDAAAELEMAAVVDVLTGALVVAEMVDTVPLPVVVMAPVVATPLVDAVPLRHEVDAPGWITSGDEYAMAPVASVSLRVMLVPA